MNGVRSVGSSRGRKTMGQWFSSWSDFACDTMATLIYMPPHPCQQADGCCAGFYRLLRQASDMCVCFSRRTPCSQLLLLAVAFLKGNTCTSPLVCALKFNFHPNMRPPAAKKSLPASGVNNTSHLFRCALDISGCTIYSDIRLEYWSQIYWYQMQIIWSHYHGVHRFVIPTNECMQNAWITNH